MHWEEEIGNYKVSMIKETKNSTRISKKNKQVSKKVMIQIQSQQRRGKTWNWWCIRGLHLTMRLGTFSFEWHRANG